MKKILLLSLLVFVACLGAAGYLNKSTRFGVISSLPSSASQNTERAAVNDLITLALNYSTTTANTWTQKQTFAAASTTDLSASNSLYLPFAGGLVGSDVNKKAYTISSSTVFGSATPGKVWMYADGGAGWYATSSSAGVTSISAGTGLNGGTITTSGTIDLKAYFATSTADVGGNILYYTTTNGTPAKIANVATTTASFSPAFATSSILGSLVGGSSGLISSVAQFSFTYATSTTWTGTTTIPIQQDILPETINGLRCSTSAGGGGTLNIQIGNGSASTTMVNASSTNNFNAFTANNIIAAGQQLSVDIGTPGTTPTKIVCTVKFTI